MVEAEFDTKGNDYVLSKVEAPWGWRRTGEGEYESLTFDDWWLKELLDREIPDGILL